MGRDLVKVPQTADDITGTRALASDAKGFLINHTLVPRSLIALISWGPFTDTSCHLLSRVYSLLTISCVVCVFVGSASRHVPAREQAAGCSPSCGGCHPALSLPVSGAPIHRSGAGRTVGVLRSLNIFIEGLLCARHWSRSRGYNVEPNRQLLPPTSWDFCFSFSILLLFLSFFPLFKKLNTVLILDLQKSCKDSTDPPSGFPHGSQHTFPRLPQLRNGCWYIIIIIIN